MDELIRDEARAGRPRSDEPAPSFEDVFTREFPRVARTVHHIVGDRARAEEVTQDAFVALLRHRRTVAGYERPDLWVRRVARARAAELRRYPSCSMTCVTAARVLALTFGWSLSTRETV